MPVGFFRLQRSAKGLFAMIQAMRYRDGLDWLGEPFDLPLGEPTNAQPGSIDKIETMRLRASQGLSLWHPADELMAIHQKGENAPYGFNFNSGFMRVLNAPRLHRVDETALM